VQAWLWSLKENGEEDEEDEDEVFLFSPFLSLVEISQDKNKNGQEE